MATKINPGQMVIYLAVVLSIVSVIFAGLFNRLDSIVLGLGIALVSYACGLNIPTVLLMASLATFLAAYLPFGHTSVAVIQGFSEGFSTDQTDTNDGDHFEDDDNFDDGEDFEGDETFEGEQFDEEFDDEDFDDEDFDDAEGFANPDEKAAKKPKTKKKRRPAPDHGSRAEMFELGKKYKLPKETDDEEYHLDAGTTFVNAYKQLKPDQISAMTKDTQELINTQKQLMSTLNTLKPLITDGKQIMDTFQNYFGQGGAPNIGDLTQMAEKFAPGSGAGK